MSETSTSGERFVMSIRCAVRAPFGSGDADQLSGVRELAFAMHDGFTVGGAAVCASANATARIETIDATLKTICERIGTTPPCSWRG